VSVAIALVAALSSWAGTGAVRRYALARDLLDHPNARGSHRVPTPRGGGLAPVLVLVVGNLLGALLGLVPDAFALTVLLGGGAVAAVGFVDDHGDVRARWRLLVHGLACLLALACLGPVRELVLPDATVDLGLLAGALSLVAGVWFVNLYNFMDGIDGLAGVELVCVGAGLAVLDASFGAGLPTLLAVAAGAGFLVWNRPPARIFLGDVGSGFLGFYLAVLLLAGVGAGSWGLWSPLILLGVFVVDATLTLLTRAVTGQRVREAHRTHAFQRLAARFGHGPVTSGVGLVNLCWLLPLAACAQRFPAWGLPLLVVAWAPLVAICLAVGAGRQRDADAAEQ
jgi:Fuc2NAc and GlcNAc transferase